MCFSFRAGLPIDAQDLFTRAGTLSAEDAVTAFESCFPVFSHTSLSPENHSNLHTLTWVGVCLHHHLTPHSMPVLDSLILRIAQTLIHSFAIFGKYQVGPLKEKSKCYVLSILLWEYLPADSMDENVPD